MLCFASVQPCNGSWSTRATVSWSAFSCFSVLRVHSNYSDCRLGSERCQNLQSTQRLNASCADTDGGCSCCCCCCSCCYYAAHRLDGRCVTAVFQERFNKILCSDISGRNNYSMTIKTAHRRLTHSDSGKWDSGECWRSDRWNHKLTLFVRSHSR